MFLQLSTMCTKFPNEKIISRDSLGLFEILFIFCIIIKWCHSSIFDEGDATTYKYIFAGSGQCITAWGSILILQKKNTVQVTNDEGWERKKNIQKCVPDEGGWRQFNR